jgi:hypothetical protein
MPFLTVQHLVTKPLEKKLLMPWNNNLPFIFVRVQQ